MQTLVCTTSWVFRSISEDDCLMAILRNGILGASARHEAAAFPLPAPAQSSDIHGTDVLQGLAAVLLNPGVCLLGLVTGCLFKSNSSVMLLKICDVNCSGENEVKLSIGKTACSLAYSM